MAEDGFNAWLFGACAVASGVVTFVLLKKFLDIKLDNSTLSRKKPLLPLGRIQKLIIYPIKSCKGVEVNSAVCTAEGLVQGNLRDRLATLNRIYVYIAVVSV